MKITLKKINFSGKIRNIIKLVIYEIVHYVFKIFTRMCQLLRNSQMNIGKIKARNSPQRHMGGSYQKMCPRNHQGEQNLKEAVSTSQKMNKALQGRGYARGYERNPLQGWRRQTKRCKDEAREHFRSQNGFYKKSSNAHIWAVEIRPNACILEMLQNRPLNAEITKGILGHL